MDEEIRSALERARRGDKEAFGQLVRHYQRRVYMTAYRITSNHQDADDVAQEAFVRAYKGLPKFDTRSQFFTWLYRIVVNVALNHLRKGRRRPTVALDDVALPEHLREQAEGDPRKALELKRLVADINSALEELSDTLRITLVLVVFDGLSYRNAAEILKCSEGTIAWRVHEAREKLRKSLAKHLREPDDSEELSEDTRGAADAH